MERVYARRMRSFFPARSGTPPPWIRDRRWRRDCRLIDGAAIEPVREAPGIALHQAQRRRRIENSVANSGLWIPWVPSDSTTGSSSRPAARPSLRW
jgi:hypothetical protein